MDTNSEHYLNVAGEMSSPDFRDDLIAEIKHLRAFAISLSRSASAADDLVQESFFAHGANQLSFEKEQI